MKTRKNRIINLCTLGMCLVGCQGRTQPRSSHYDELANLPFPGSYPTEESAQILKDELTFQRGVQTYLWSMPAQIRKEVEF